MLEVPVEMAIDMASERIPALLNDPLRVSGVKGSQNSGGRRRYRPRHGCRKQQLEGPPLPDVQCR